MNELVKIMNNEVVVSSRDVAKNFGKYHKDVLEGIVRISSAENSAQSFFTETTYKDRSGKSNKEYLMNRDGFSLLVMGFTGQKALEWKIKYIEAFNKMEAQLKSKPATIAQQILAQAQMLVDMEKKVAEHEEAITDTKRDVKRLENNIRRTVTSTQLTVIAYANIKGIKPRSYNSAVIGRRATKICKQEGLPIGSVVDSKYGYINTYPQDVLDRVFF